MTRGAFVVGLLLACLVGLSWFVRDAQHRRVEFAGQSGWITTDPDSLYQMRRVERALDEGLPPAEFDERLSAPNGSAIPWPPYYVTMLTTVLRPFAPEADRAAWVERAVGSAACVFSVLGSVLAALAARKLAGNSAAVVAGVTHALCGASVAYGKIGNGDHHAFVSLVVGAMLFVVSCGLDERVLANRRNALLVGCAAGALAGVALGSWVASLMYVIEVQLALGVLVVLHSRKPREGTALLGLGFHLAALAVLAPAIASSPWRATQPWIVVNLSWFHPAFLSIGALVFVPFLWWRESSRALRVWPWIVAFTLVSLGLWLALGEGGPARGVREGFEWVSRVDGFMARVGESRPLVGSGTGSDLFEALGYHVLALPIVWIALLWVLLRRHDLRLLPWAIALPLLAAQSARQARFAEALVLPFAVVLGWAFARFVAEPLMRRTPRVPTMTWTLIGALLVCAGSLPTLALTSKRRAAGSNAATFERAPVLGARLACAWIGSQPELTPGESVMSIWTHGHAIEFVARRASVATNFGTYVGIDGFTASPRFFLTEDFEAADELLAFHRTRFVLVDSDLPNTLNMQLDAVEPELRARYVAAGSERGGSVLPAWFLTCGARLMFDGAVFGPLGKTARPLDRLRCVWISPLVDPERRLRSPNDVAPAAWVWERVAGASIEASGSPGDRFELAVHMVFPDSRREVRWVDSVSVGVDGIARLRVPYSTDAVNGMGRASGPATWSLGNRRGSLAIPEHSVRTGTVVHVP